MMRRESHQLLLIVLVLCLGGSVRSRSIENDFSQTGTKQIAIYCKVWGFLKYFHPNINQCEINWDDCFVSLYPSIKESRDINEFNALLLKLLAMGRVSNGLRLKQSTDTRLHSMQSDTKKTNLIDNYDNSWISKEALFLPELKDSLESLYRSFTPIESCNATIPYGSTGFVFQSQRDKIDTTVFPDESIRVLALSRYWNVINYFYPYKSKIRSKWDSILEEYIDKVVISSDSLAYHLAMLSLCNSIDDSHSFTSSRVIRKYLKEANVPIQFSCVENKTVITGIEEQYHSNYKMISVGDVLEEIDGISISDIQNVKWNYVPGSNNASKYRNVNEILCSGPINTQVTLSIVRGKHRYEVILPRVVTDTIAFYKRARKTDAPYSHISKDIGYVNMASLEVKDVARLFEDLIKTKHLIVDLRCYPNGTLHSLCRYLSTPTPFACAAIPDIKFPGKFLMKEPAKAGFEKKYFGKIIVLVNELTQSQAEFCAMALRAMPDTKIIGDTTSGADGDISRLNLPGGIYTTFSGLGIYYPDLKETQRIGIVPDIMVEPTVEGVRNGKDEILEYAIRMIHSK